MIVVFILKQEAILPVPRRAARKRQDDGELPRSPGTTHEAILIAATARFGEHGYQNTKWADVAAAVGVGSTALYYHFESKLHCLYVIMADALGWFEGEFRRITTERIEYLDALVALLRSGFELNDQDVLRNRVLVAEQGLVALRRQARREEEARELARARTRDLEFAWAAFLVRGMELGHVEETDARLLTRALLGLYNSVWHWYRPGGGIRLEELADFFIRRQLALLSLSPDLADGSPPPRMAAAGRRPGDSGSPRRV
jgi:AcrR family transcriptional regulator